MLCTGVTKPLKIILNSSDEFEPSWRIFGLCPFSTQLKIKNWPKTSQNFLIKNDLSARKLKCPARLGSTRKIHSSGSLELEISSSNSSLVNSLSVHAVSNNLPEILHMYFRQKVEWLWDYTFLNPLNTKFWQITAEQNWYHRPLYMVFLISMYHQLCRKYLIEKKCPTINISTETKMSLGAPCGEFCI